MVSYLLVPTVQSFVLASGAKLEHCDGELESDFDLDRELRTGFMPAAAYIIIIDYHYHHHQPPSYSRHPSDTCKTSVSAF